MTIHELQLAGNEAYKAGIALTNTEKEYEEKLKHFRYMLKQVSKEIRDKYYTLYQTIKEDNL